MMIGLVLAMENWEVGLGVAQTIAVVAGVPIIIRQLSLQRQAADDAKRANAYQAYQTIGKNYSELMWMAAADRTLASVWEPFEENRQRELESKQMARHLEGPTESHPLEEHGAYFVMTDDERRAYRFTRTALEIFEQAFQIHRMGWIDEETWQKWDHQFDPWRRTRFVTFVLQDHRSRFLVSFVEFLESASLGRTPVLTAQDKESIEKMLSDND